jgi:repressor LexA
MSDPDRSLAIHAPWLNSSVDSLASEMPLAAQYLAQRSRNDDNDGAVLMPHTLRYINRPVNPLHAAFAVGAPHVMCLRMLKERILALLEVRGVKARKASIDAGLGPDGIRNILRGASKNPTTSTLEALARYFAVTVDYLLGKTDEGAPPFTVRPAGEFKRLPIRHRVQAGAWRERDDLRQENTEYAPMGEVAGYHGIDQWAERLLGDSMNEVYPDGTLLHVIDAAPFQLRNGDHVIVERSRDQGGLVERTCKELRISPTGVRTLVGRSRNALWNKPIEYETSGDDDTVQVVAIVIGHYVPRHRA